MGKVSVYERCVSISRFAEIRNISSMRGLAESAILKTCSFGDTQQAYWQLSCCMINFLGQLYEQLGQIRPNILAAVDEKVD